MEGIADRDRKAMERIVLQAWWNSNLDGAGAKLRQPAYYLDQLKPRKRQTADEVLEVFREHQARGAPVKITLIRPEEVN